MEKTIGTKFVFKFDKENFNSIENAEPIQQSVQQSLYYVPGKEFNNFNDFGNIGDLNNFSSQQCSCKTSDFIRNTRGISQSLMDVASRGNLVRTSKYGTNYKNGNFINNCPYPENSIVICDYCDRRGLVIFIHHNDMDLCLTCARDIFECAHK